MNVRLIDTSILLNLLGVPGRCQDAETVKIEFDAAIREKDTLILPFATIIETGNKIAQIRGERKHHIAEKFTEYLKRTALDEAPWSCASFDISNEDLFFYSEHFLDYADKSVGMGDLSIIHHYEKCKELLPVGNIMIWSTDQHLSAYKEINVYKHRRRR